MIKEPRDQAVRKNPARQPLDQFFERNVGRNAAQERWIAPCREGRLVFEHVGQILQMFSDISNLCQGISSSLDSYYISK